jgi:glycosyltransferase involved in cell wall biosynthesis
MEQITHQKSANKSNCVAVSVVIPVYNCVEYTPAALESVFAQTFTDFEVVLVNDGSPETEMLERLIDPYQGRICYVKQANRGPSAARNTGIRAANGKFVAFLDSDDRWPPEYLDAQIRLFDKNPSLDLVYTDAVYFGDIPLARKTFMQSLTPPVNFEELLVQGSQIAPSATVVRKQAIIDAGLFDEALRGAEDYDLCLRIAHRRAKIIYQSKVFALRRLHSRSLTCDDTRMLEALECVLSKLDKNLSLSSETRSLLLNRLASVRTYICLENGKRQLVSGDIDQARNHFVSAYTFFRQTNWRLTSPVPDSAIQALLRTAKLRVLLWGLRTIPSVTASGARVWENFLLALRGLKVRSTYKPGDA